MLDSLIDVLLLHSPRYEPYVLLCSPHGIFMWLINNCMILEHGGNIKSFYYSIPTYCCITNLHTLHFLGLNYMEVSVNGGYPNSWMVSLYWKIPSINGWWLGLPLFQETTIYDHIIHIIIYYLFFIMFHHSIIFHHSIMFILHNIL